MNATLSQKSRYRLCTLVSMIALALMLALASPELDVLGITTVAGNVPSDLGTKNALKILAHCHQLKIPVYRGADRPLKRDYVSAQDTHGNDGLGQSKLPEIHKTITKCL